MQSLGDCEKIEGLEALKSKRFVVFGELHGTAESPKFVGEVVCANSKYDRTVLALEWPIDLSPAVRAYLASKDEASAYQSLLANSYWRTRMPDGKSSEAMLSLVRRIHFLRSRNHDIEVVLFDEPTENEGRSSSLEREQRMADRLKTVLDDKSRNARIYVLTGNLHSRLTKGVAWNKEFESLAYRLRDEKPLSFNLAHSGGTAWICSRRDACHEQTFRATPTDGMEISRPTLQIVDGGVDGHSGVYFVGTISASSPVRLPQPTK